MRLLGAIRRKMQEFQELGKSAMPMCERNFPVLAVTGVQKLPDNRNSLKIGLWRCAISNVPTLSAEV